MCCDEKNVVYVVVTRMLCMCGGDKNVVYVLWSQECFVCVCVLW